MLHSIRISVIFSAVALLLLIPFIAMQFTQEVNWSLGDFLVMGFLLSLLGFGFDFVWRNAKSIRRRLFFGLLVVAFFLLVWAELAVGVFGSPFAGN